MASCQDAVNESVGSPLRQATGRFLTLLVAWMQSVARRQTPPIRRVEYSKINKIAKVKQSKLKTKKNPI